MKDYLSIGSSPAGEDCIQVGASDYYTKGRKELESFKKQLERQFGEPPVGARFTIKSFPHDFGTYHEVCVVFDDENEEATEFAFKVENETPEYWDEEARKELDIKII